MEEEVEGTILLSLEHLQKLGVTHIAFNSNNGFFEFGSITKDFAGNDKNPDLRISCQKALARFVESAQRKAKEEINELVQSSLCTIT
jgi:hypothetical protein